MLKGFETVAKILFRIKNVSSILLCFEFVSLKKILNSRGIVVVDAVVVRSAELFVVVRNQDSGDISLLFKDCLKDLEIGN